MYILLQVASSVERPAAEGEEACKVNGHAEVEVNNHKVDFYFFKFMETFVLVKFFVEVFVCYVVISHAAEFLIFWSALNIGSQEVLDLNWPGFPNIDTWRLKRGFINQDLEN